MSQNIYFFLFASVGREGLGEGVCAREHRCLWKPEEGARAPGTGVTGTFVHWEANSGSTGCMYYHVCTTTRLWGPHVATSSTGFGMFPLVGTLPPGKPPGGATQRMPMFSPAGHGACL